MIKGINSIGFFDAKAKRMDIYDRRFYYSPKSDKYYINLTTVIKEGGPTSPHLITWFKQVGLNADQILKEAGDFGSAVHDLIDKNLKGEDSYWMDDTGRQLCPRDVWEAFLKFVEFRKIHKPFVYANELIMISEFFDCGMTGDMICKIGDENWIIDFKSSNYIHEDHFIQVAVTAYTWNEYFPEHPIHRVGLLHLKADTRGPDKKGKKLQGKGWQVVEPPKHYKHYIPAFKRRMEEWKEKNPVYNPRMFSLPTMIKGYASEPIVSGVVEGKPELFSENEVSSPKDK